MSTNALRAAFREFLDRCDVAPAEHLITRAAFVAGVVAGMRGVAADAATARDALRELDEELYALKVALLAARAARGLS